MQSPEKAQNRNHRRALLVVLFFTLCSLYMITYSARIESTDTLFLFDATGSLVRYGDLKLDTSAGVRPPAPNPLALGTQYPLPEVGSEPLQIILAAPLYALADQLPGVGMVHGVYLFNVLVSAAAGCALYVYARVLGYSDRAGVLAAFMLAAGTIVWPYSKTFFQEPLALLLILLAALMLEKWRSQHYRGIHWLILAMLIFGAALFSKAAAALALPGLVIIAAPRLTLRRLAIMLVIMAALGGVILLMSEPLGIAGRISRTIQILRSPSPNTPIALHSYLLSIGGSIWGTSPVILLALPGAWLSRRYRHLAAAVVMALCFACIYAFWQSGSWFGGLSWPPRFLIPVVPFGIIAAFPVLERVLRAPRNRWLTGLVAAIFAYGIWIQLSAVTVLWREYGHALPPESGGLGEWGGGLNLVQYLRWVVVPGLWPHTELDFIWVRTGVGWWPLLFGLLLLSGGWLIWRMLRRPGSVRRLVAAVPVVFALSVLVGLRGVHDDPLFDTSNPALQTMRDIILTETEPDDMVLLSDLAYERFFTNQDRSGSPRVVGLPFQPGEQPSPEQPAEVISDNPDVLIHPTTGPFLFALAQQHDRLFLLASSGPFIPWSVRPVERFMSTYYYPIREIETGPQVRLIEYATTPSPAPYPMLGPAYTTDLQYGDSIRLIGYELPQATHYAPGDALPISLYWQTDAALDTRYKVALFMRHADGAPLTQGWDSEPGGGFTPTDAWLPHVPVWDNRALRLPADTPPGSYRLWVVLYATGADGTIQNLPVTGTDTVEGYIGVLPVTIEVEA